MKDLQVVHGYKKQKFQPLMGLIWNIRCMEFVLEFYLHNPYIIFCYFIYNLKEIKNYDLNFYE